MTRYLDLPIAELANLIIAISATAILIAGAIMLTRLGRAAARAIQARMLRGRSVSPPESDRPYYFDTITWDWPV